VYRQLRKCHQFRLVLLPMRATVCWIARLLGCVDTSGLELLAAQQHKFGPNQQWRGKLGVKGVRLQDLQAEPSMVRWVTTFDT
jgi:hypothetical protein